MKTPDVLYSNQEPVIGEDLVLCLTIFITGFYMSHEPNEVCWCEPKVIFKYDEHGEVDDYTIIHNELQ